MLLPEFWGENTLACVTFHEKKNRTREKLFPCFIRLLFQEERIIEGVNISFFEF